MIHLRNINGNTLAILSRIVGKQGKITGIMAELLNKCNVVLCSISGRVVTLERENQVMQKSDDFLVYKKRILRKVGWKNCVKNVEKMWKKMCKGTTPLTASPQQKSNPNVPPRYYLLRGFM